MSEPTKKRMLRYGGGGFFGRKGWGGGLRSKGLGVTVVGLKTRGGTEK